MQDVQVLLQSQHIFGPRTWVRLPVNQWHVLNLPSHLEDQVLRVTVSKGPVAAAFECQVAEQFPKDAFSHLGKSLRSLGFERAVVNVLHNRSPNAHVMFLDEAKGPSFHLDLDFANLSAFDCQILEWLKKITLPGWTDMMRALRGQKIGNAFFKSLRHQLGELGRLKPQTYDALVDVVLKILFLVFVQRKGWLNFDPYYLESKMQACHARGLSVLQCFLRPLFARLEGHAVREWIPLGTLPRLGGGLFSFRPEYLPPIPNEWLLNLYRNLVANYSFSLFETRHDREVVGISPEVLGHVFENLLTHPDRKSLGTYFTPMTLAQRQVDLGLDALLVKAQRDAPGETFRKHLESLKILDPSCGSGTYLVAAFQGLLQRHLLVAPEKERYNGKLFELKRKIVTNNLFGIDIHPMAVRLAEVRLWLNMIQDLEVSDPEKAPPLPSLQHHLRAGDFLGQYVPKEYGRIQTWPKLKRLFELREKFPYVGALKRAAYLNHIMRMESELMNYLATKAELAEWENARTQALQTVLPGIHPYPENSSKKGPKHYAHNGQLHIMFCKTILEGGFDLIVGNPPWLSAAKMAKGHRRQILNQLPAFPGLRLSGQIDLSMYFLIASLAILKEEGHLGFLIPGKLLQAKYAGGMRRFLGTSCEVSYLFDYGVDQGLLFQADTFPLAIGIGWKKPDGEHQVQVEVWEKGNKRRFLIPQSRLRQDASAWVLAEKKSRVSSSKKFWPTLKEFGFEVKRGVVTNCKKQFVFTCPPGHIAQSHLRPLLRGRDIQNSCVEPGAWIYWPFEQGLPKVDHLGKEEATWLGTCSKVRKDGASFLLPYKPPQPFAWYLIWKYLGKTWEVALIKGGSWIPDQTTYYLGFDEFKPAYQMFAFAHHPSTSEFLTGIAERGKDRFFFFYAHTVGALPIPPFFESFEIDLPEPGTCHLPEEGKALWSGKAGQERLSLWKKLCSDYSNTSDSRLLPGLSA